MQWREVEDDDALTDDTGHYLLRRCMGNREVYWLLCDGELLSQERLTMAEAEKLISARGPLSPVPTAVIHDSADYADALAMAMLYNDAARAREQQTRFVMASGMPSVRMNRDDQFFTGQWASGQPSPQNVLRCSDLLPVATPPVCSGDVSIPLISNEEVPTIMPDNANSSDNISNETTDEFAPLTETEENSENLSPTTGQIAERCNNDSDESSGNVAENNVTQTQERIMYIAEDQAREMLTACGLKTAREASTKKLMEHVNSLVSYQDDLNLPEDPDLKRLYKKCLETKKDGGEIAIGEEPEPDGHSEENGNGATATAVATKKKTGKKVGRPATAVNRIANVRPRASGSGKARKQKVEVGEVFIRKYKGEDHKAKAMADGTFQYNGERYSSLTNVAKAITGYPSISGPVFFGLTKVKSAS